ncbi:molybdopterin molybdotransferase MoeA [Candidatus Poribacteria bacterium]|nr:molybdopterin molybdotransferase MoeA [Candidatus Poribacteria bacterium]MBT5535146.1 molybdopterin molybdotransferase MoeA [Candidatus Poribacteria bacterium]MBT5715269.1 molybdopterin molybdotransferase MoeA [Candidatus Poribacteria bacterium]MBT7098642.1 molybdopterin molybdotransferase MoeA [Candidatus Poribacteria bacterium]
MLSVDEALARMLATITTATVERAPVLECLGRVLAEDAVATEDNPPFDNSAMDGFAVRASDLTDASEQNPVTLPVIEDIPAGIAPTQVVGAGTVSRIMTGAMLPEGADAVVMVESTRADGDNVALMEAPRLRQHIRPTGESVRAGDVVLEAGTMIQPAEMAMLASLNISAPSVYRRPRVAVISTGDELTPPGEPLEPGKIRDSNRYGLYGQIVEAGAEPVDLGIVSDDAADVENRLRRAVDEADALVTSGGVSVGDYDVVKDVLLKLGTLDFWRVAMKPGKPQAFGQIQGKPVFALPGNPVSSMVVFELFARPALLKMGGHARLQRQVVRALMDEAVANDSRGRVNYMRVTLERRDGRLHARTTGTQGSGVLRSLVLADGLAIIGDEGAPVGGEVDVVLTSAAPRSH